MVDLRALAERLNVLMPCECGRNHHKRVLIGGVPTRVEACVACSGSGRRLPTEAELRAAIRAEGWPVLVARRIEEDFVSLEVCRSSEQRDVSAVLGEADSHDLFWLALLRALEVCRG